MAGMVRIVLVVTFVLFIFACSPNSLVLSGNIKNKAEISNEGRLDEILNEIAPSAKYALLIGSDGTAALVTSRSFSKIYIQKNNQEWNSKAEELPAFCNIRDLKEICIYSRTTNTINSFSERMNNFEFLGQSSKNDHYAKKYTEQFGD